MVVNNWRGHPNEKYINWILSCSKSDPMQWPTNVSNITATINARDAANDIIETTPSKEIVWDQVWYKMILGPVRSISDPLSALIAWDDCGYMIESEIGELEIIAKFGDPRAILLLPACKVYNFMKGKVL